MDKNPRGNSNLLDAVFPTQEQLVEAVAEHHAIINTGQEDILDEAFNIGQAWQMNLERHCDGMSENEAMKCCEGEKEHFMKDSIRQVALVVKAGMPLTIRSAETFWPPPPAKKRAPKPV